MKHFAVGLAALAVGIGDVSQVSANVIVFTDQASFFGATSVVSTENFDEFPPNTIVGFDTVTIDGVVYLAPGNSWVAGIHLGLPGFVSPPNDFGINLITPNRLSFGPGFSSEELGFFLLGGGGDPSQPQTMGTLQIM